MADPTQDQPPKRTVGKPLSFTAGTSSDSLPSTDKNITLEEAVLRIYDDQSPTASPPSSYFFYGGVTQRGRQLFD